MVAMGRSVSGCAMKLYNSQMLRVLTTDATHFVIRSSMDRSSRMKVGRVILDKSAPGRSWAMMWERTGMVSVLARKHWVACASSRHTIVLLLVDDGLVYVGRFASLVC
jgi:hypothetical protein